MDELETFQSHLTTIANKWGCTVMLVNMGIINQSTNALRINIEHKKVVKTIGRVLHEDGSVIAVCALHGGHPFWWTSTDDTIPLDQIIDRLEDLMATLCTTSGGNTTRP